ncbi:unnamed protein product, partial [Heterotrigona itama]
SQRFDSLLVGSYPQIGHKKSWQYTYIRAQDSVSFLVSRIKVPWHTRSLINLLHEFSRHTKKKQSLQMDCWRSNSKYHKTPWHN